MDNNSGDENPYRELIVNNAGKIENTLSQMEQWSLNNVINYVQYGKNPKTSMPCQLNLQINKNKNNVGRNQGEKDRSASEVSLIDTSGRLTEEYLYRYEGV